MVSRPRPARRPCFFGLSAVVALFLAAPAWAVAGITVTPRTLSTAEGGSAQTFTVRLAIQPGADVEIDIRSNDPTEGTVSPAILWFGPTARTVVVGRTPRNISRWDDARTVTVRPKDDTVAGLAQEYTITLDAGSVDDNGIVQDAYDNDDAGVPNRTVTAVNDGTDAPDETVRVSGTSSAGVGHPRDVLVTGDTVDEPDETIRVTLRRPTNATGTPTGTIGDDDPTPQATLARASGAATTPTVAAAPVSPAVGADFRVSANRRPGIDGPGRTR